MPRCAVVMQVKDGGRETEEAFQGQAGIGIASAGGSLSTPPPKEEVRASLALGRCPCRGQRSNERAAWRSLLGRSRPAFRRNSCLLPHEVISVRPAPSCAPASLAIIIPRPELLSGNAKCNSRSLQEVGKEDELRGRSALANPGKATSDVSSRCWASHCRARHQPTGEGSSSYSVGASPREHRMHTRFATDSRQWTRSGRPSSRPKRRGRRP